LIERIAEDCPQLVILMLLTVALYEPQGHFCITKIHDRWTKNLGNWSNQDVTFLRGQVDLNKSTTSLFFERENMSIAISCFVAIFNIILFTLLGANKALKLRTKKLRRDYFLVAILSGALILCPFCIVLCVSWKQKLNRSQGFWITWLIFLILDVIGIFIAGGVLVWAQRNEEFSQDWICWREKKAELGFLYETVDKSGRVIPDRVILELPVAPSKQPETDAKIDS